MFTYRVTSPIPLLLCFVNISLRVGGTDTLFMPTPRDLVFFFFFLGEECLVVKPLLSDANKKKCFLPTLEDMHM